MLLWLLPNVRADAGLTGSEAVPGLAVGGCLREKIKHHDGGKDEDERGGQKSNARVAVENGVSEAPS